MKDTLPRSEGTQNNNSNSSLPKPPGQTINQRRILSRVFEDLSFDMSRRDTRRLEPVEGHEVQVRFLPVRFGKDGLWYARIAEHRLYGNTITCPRVTSKDRGGGRPIDCPVCLLAEELENDRNEVISNFGSKVMANPQFLTYCLLRKIERFQLPMEQVVKPYEFLLEESVWKQLAWFYLGGAAEASDSVLDYDGGNDFKVIKAENGTRLNKTDPAPIFDADAPTFKENVNKVEEAVKHPKVEMPTLAGLEYFADKVQEAAIKTELASRQRVRPRAVVKDGVLTKPYSRIEVCARSGPRM